MKNSSPEKHKKNFTRRGVLRLGMQVPIFLYGTTLGAYSNLVFSNSYFHGDTPYGDIPYGDLHVDAEHLDTHMDSPFIDNHSDIPYTDIHSDSPHIDTHSDTPHEDTHLDTPHNDTAHGDDYCDEPFHTDAHFDVPHCDEPHVDMPPIEIEYCDTPHTDTHFDIEICDLHTDIPHGDTPHMDSHIDSPHVDNHTDSPHIDTHTDIPHVDSHIDSPHVDNHTDSPHIDTHTDTPHVDTDHVDTAHCDGLPVELISFEAKTEEGNITLFWVTASETNNSGFEVQTLIDNNGNWEKIGFVEGNATTNEKQEYSFLIPEKLSGDYYYRLKQIDFDGHFEFSQIVTVKVRNSKDFVLSIPHPNPFSDRTSFSLTLAFDQSVQVNIFDMRAQKVQTLFEGHLSPNELHNFTFDGRSLPNGEYLITASSKIFTSTRRVVLLR